MEKKRVLPWGNTLKKHKQVAIKSFFNLVKVQAKPRMMIKKKRDVQVHSPHDTIKFCDKFSSEKQDTTKITNDLNG